MRKFLFLLLLVGCGSPQDKGSGSSNILRMEITSDIETLDPRCARSLAAQSTCKMLYDGLMRIDEEGKPIPSLAQVISISPDQRTYTVTLQDSLWTDGEPVSAYDFEYAWKSVLSPNSAFDCAAMLYCLENGKEAHAGSAPTDSVGVSAINPKMLIIRLKEPTPYFLELLAHPLFSPLHKSTIEGKVGKAPVTNGPFMVKKERLQDCLILVKNPTYWDADAVSLDGITLQVVPDATSATLLFQKGQLDWIGSPLSDLPHEYAKQAYQEGTLCVIPVAATLWYKFNTTRPPLDNPKIRKALSLAINRQELIDHILRPGLQSTLSPLPPALSVGGQQALDGSLLEAKRLLHEACEEMGLTEDQLPRITLTYTHNDNISKLTQALQQQWKQVLGLEVELEATEFKTLLTKMGRMDYQMGGAKIWIADYQDPTTILSLYTEKEEPGQGGVNETGWENVEYRRLLERAGFEIDREKRRALLESAEAIFIEEMPVLPICDSTYCYQKRGFTGERIPSAGCPDFKWVRKS